MNVLFIGLPIALVLIFGEKFSLWINLLTLGCVLFVSAILSMIGDEYESPKRILFALLGASIAAGLKVLAYPGHTAVIILATILVIGAFDLIDRGKIIWLEFYRSARLKLMGKFLLLLTFLFLIGLIIANFGNQTIWLPLAATFLIILVLFGKDDYLELRGFDDNLLIMSSLAILLLTGLTSTVIEFRAVELILGINLGTVTLIVLTLSVIALISIAINKRRKRQVALRALRQKNAAEEQRRAEESKKRAAEEAEKKETRRQFIEQEFKKIASNQSGLTAEDFSILLEDKDQGVNLVFVKKVIESNLCQHVTVSNNKKQIVWNGHFRDSLLMLLYAAEKSFEDANLNYLIQLVKNIRADIKGRKDKKIEYEGEPLLMQKLQDIEMAAKKI